ncbi:cytochrome P450 [Dendrothele bispora CBS 962.96]|uniref:Cytochrome P450 n=1 Tax=Dendrothele bispora (strain CBS 962.96) TaxID=1314807 RepID=A0A4S8L9P1_DENBC|nr:cytochrome P450 [Dendrothele bispora CBS 962.96]
MSNSLSIFSNILSKYAATLSSGKWWLVILELVAGCSLALLVTRLASRQNSKLPLPPGPPKEPILGHLRLMPSENQADVFHAWAKVYGAVIGLHFLGRNVIVLDSFEAAHDLLEDRSFIYSCRPRFVIYELMGFVPVLTFLQYHTAEFLKHRKMFQTFLGKHESAEYIPYQAEYAKILARNLMEKPEKYLWYLEKFTTSVIVRITSGYQIVEDDDTYIKIAQDVSKGIGNSGSPGNTPVDYFPWLRHLPSWFPGTFYAFYARSIYEKIRRVCDVPVEYVRKQMADGIAQPSFVYHHLDALNAEVEAIEDPEKKKTLYEEELVHIAGAAGTMYAAGGETSYATLQTFVLAMMLHPEIQNKAQAEIDHVLSNTGGDLRRFPEIEDRENLPFVECILQETFRWHPVLPLGVPHRSIKSDVYNGMFIPEGSIIFPNVRGMSLNEHIYSNPYKFNPMRFMSKENGGKGEPYFPAQWGFGRRICPGRYLAETGLWLAIATILATLSIQKAKDENGKEIEPKIEFTDGLVSQPCPFKCNITPRSKSAATLLVLHV